MSDKKLEDKILEEVKKTGFPLELRISQLLQDNRYYVANNLYFLDRDEGKGREVDLRALKNFECQRGGKVLKWVRHCLILECKKSSEKPWVILTSPTTSYDGGVAELECEGFNPLDMQDNIDIYMEYLYELDRIHPFSKYERRGRSYFEAFKNLGSGSVIFSALTTAVKAAIAGREDKFGASDNSACYYYPMVVFDGRLFEAYLHSGKIQVQEVDSVMISFFYQSRQYEKEQFIVPVLTEGALKDFLLSLDKVLLFLGNLVEINLD